MSNGNTCVQGDTLFALLSGKNYLTARFSPAGNAMCESLCVYSYHTYVLLTRQFVLSIVNITLYDKTATRTVTPFIIIIDYFYTVCGV